MDGQTHGEKQYVSLPFGRRHNSTESFKFLLKTSLYIAWASFRDARDLRLFHGIKNNNTSFEGTTNATENNQCISDNRD